VNHRYRGTLAITLSTKAPLTLEWISILSMSMALTNLENLKTSQFLYFRTSQVSLWHPRFLERINVTDVMVNKVPRHYLTFPEDSYRELSQITKEKYDVRNCMGWISRAKYREAWSTARVLWCTQMEMCTRAHTVQIWEVALGYASSRLRASSIKENGERIRSTGVA